MNRPSAKDLPSVRQWFIAGLLVSFALAGCFSRVEPEQPPEGAAIASPEEAPTICDAARPALLHRPDGELSAEQARPVPCLSRIGKGTHEPTIGVTGRGAVFVSTMPPEEAKGVSRSTDEGMTWKHLVPQLAGVPTHPETFDPYLYVDPLTSRIFRDDLLPPFNCSILSWSDDDGATWDHSVAGCAETDQQRIVAGPSRSSPTVGYPNIVYRCAMNTVGVEVAATTTTCQRSLDGGRTWLPPGAPAYVADPRREGHFGVPGMCGAGFGHPAVAPSGRLYLAKGWCGEPWLAWSDDEGLTWTRSRVSDLPMGQSVDEDFGLVFSGVDVYHAAIAVDRGGNVYYAWIPADHLPRLIVSRDAGSTWTRPLTLAPPDVREANLVQLAAGGVGKIAIAYIGSTNAPGAPYDDLHCFPDMTACISLPPAQGYENVTWNGYMAISVDALAEAPTFATAAVNEPGKPILTGRCGTRCGAQGDFIDVRIAPDGTPWASFVDGCSDGDCRRGLVNEGLAGRLWGGPSLWDEADSNGPFS